MTVERLLAEIQRLTIREVLELMAALKGIPGWDDLNQELEQRKK